MNERGKKEERVMRVWQNSRVRKKGNGGKIARGSERGAFPLKIISQWFRLKW